jgi:hypothetical protein
MTEPAWLPGERRKKCGTHGFWVREATSSLPCPHPACDFYPRDKYVLLASAVVDPALISESGEINYDDIEFASERTWVRKKYRIGDDDQAVIGWAWEEQK